jgi:hypothetical protein
MGLIQSLLERLKSKKARYADAEEELRIQKKLQERQLSSNERELNSYLEEERQKQIKGAVERFRQKKRDEFWHGNKIIDRKNIFTNQKSIMRNNKSLYRGRSLYLNG